MAKEPVIHPHSACPHPLASPRGQEVKAGFCGGLNTPPPSFIGRKGRGSTAPAHREQVPLSHHSSARWRSTNKGSAVGWGRGPQDGWVGCPGNEACILKTEGGAAAGSGPARGTWGAEGPPLPALAQRLPGILAPGPLGSFRENAAGREEGQSFRPRSPASWGVPGPGQAPPRPAVPGNPGWARRPLLGSRGVKRSRWVVCS